MTDRPFLLWPCGLLSVCVCIAGALIGWRLAVMSLGIYQMEVGNYSPRTTQQVETFAQWAGAIGGVIAGVIWSVGMLSMVESFTRNPTSPPPRWIARGAWLGVVVGLVATMILHASIMMYIGRFVRYALYWGLLFGVPAGAAVGMFFATMVRSLASGSPAGEFSDSES